MQLRIFKFNSYAQLNIKSKNLPWACAMSLDTQWREQTQRRELEVFRNTTPSRIVYSIPNPKATRDKTTFLLYEKDENALHLVILYYRERE